MDNQSIEIDGSLGEAGGQILRTACALSAVKKIPCRVFNIRSGRPRPGLMTQHLLGIQALNSLCNGRLEGDYLGSQEIKFWPGEIKPRDLHVKIGTAGSIILVLQTLIPLVLFSPEPVKIIFEGGSSDGFFSPTIDYFRYVFLGIMEKAGLKVGVNILKRGFCPEGGAKAEVKVFPAKIKGLNLTERGKLNKILIISGASESLKNKKVSERQIAGVREVLGKLKLPLEEKAEYYEASCPGSQITLIAEFDNTVIGTANVGKLGKRAEDVGKETALELLQEAKSDTCLDKHIADQILPYLALASGKSQVSVSEITEHCKTNISVIEKFIEGKFEIKDNLINWQPNI